MRTIKLTIAYDGTGFCGWQKQENGPSIQEELERAASIICNSPIAVHGAGRTDAGVHAFGMTAHFLTQSGITCHKLSKGLNSLLPDTIRITKAIDAHVDFHARFSAKSKTYRYAVYTGELLCPTQRLYTAHFPYQLDLAVLRKCLAVVEGTHDFSSFETSGSRDKTLTKGRGAVRTILQTRLEIPAEDSLLHLYFTGDGFLRHMVRNLSGTVLETARGRFTVDQFMDILKKCDRQQAGPTAPACGLFLVSVNYDDEEASDLSSGYQLPTYR